MGSFNPGPQKRGTRGTLGVEISPDRGRPQDGLEMSPGLGLPAGNDPLQIAP